jgi:ribonuclease HI
MIAWRRSPDIRALCVSSVGLYWKVISHLLTRYPLFHSVQSFLTEEEANSFLTGKRLSTQGTTPFQSEPSRFYGVQRGRVPGVYSDWAKAQEQIRGFTRPRYKKFATLAEAEEFVRQGQDADPTRDHTSSIAVPPGLTAETARDGNGIELPAGTGPLPLGAEDGFDPNVLLDPSTGKVVYKTKEQKAATKTIPTGPPGMLRIYTDGSSLRNGTRTARAGVGVYFGPGDGR